MRADPSMYFQHSEAIWHQFPELAAGIAYVEGVAGIAVEDAAIVRLIELADRKLAGRMESELPEIQAWRRAFAKMGLKPTQYRCSAESLLRRYRKEGELPRILPLIDLYNAISLAFALPVAVFDLAGISGAIEVRHANGDERFTTLTGEIETPPPGEVIFADDAGQAHARRWSHRQSGGSAVSETTGSILIVSEAMHDSAVADIEAVVSLLVGELKSRGATLKARDLLSAGHPRFEF